MSPRGTTADILAQELFRFKKKKVQIICVCVYTYT